MGQWCKGGGEAALTCSWWRRKEEDKDDAESFLWESRGSKKERSCLRALVDETAANAWRSSARRTGELCGLEDKAGGMKPGELVLLRAGLVNAAQVRPCTKWRSEVKVWCLRCRMIPSLIEARGSDQAASQNPDKHSAHLQIERWCDSLVVKRSWV